MSAENPDLDSFAGPIVLPTRFTIFACFDLDKLPPTAGTCFGSLPRRKRTSKWMGT